MAKKTKIRVTFDSIFLCIFVVISLVVLILNQFIPNLKVMTFFQTAGMPFDFSNPLNYIKTVTHIFGSDSIFGFLFCASWLFLIAPPAEATYGTVFSSIMIVLAAIFSGVLGTCFCKVPICGFEPVLFMFVFLNLIASLKKNQLPLVQILMFAILVAYELCTPEKPDLIVLFVDMAGGLCGSLISFLTVPKGKKSSRSKKVSDVEELKPARPWYDNEADSPRFKNNSSSEETVVGTLKL